MILIIAYGNSLRRDDGAGLSLGRMLESALRRRGRKVKRISLHQLDPEVSLAVAEEDVTAVVFADTRAAFDNDNLSLHVERVDGDAAKPLVVHHMGPSAVMAYASLLYGKAPPAWTLTVPGLDFDHGEGFSRATRTALENLASFLDALPHDWPESPNLHPSCKD